MSIYSKDVSINNGDLIQTEIHLYGSSRLGVYNLQNKVQHDDPNPGRIITFTRGNKFFELSNHLGNILATVSDKKLQYSSDNATVDYFTADVVSANDYYPFGMLMPGRKYSVANTNYRYGFNGKELDKEVAGTTTYDYGFRIYNPGLGRFLSVDPITKKYPMLTPYQFTSNSPISGVDLDGLEYYYAADGKYLGQSIKGGTQLRIATKYETLKNGSTVFYDYTQYETNSEVSRLGRNEGGTFTGIRSLSNDEVGRLLAYGNEVFAQSAPSHTSIIETTFDESIGRIDRNGNYGLLDFKIVAYDLFNIDKGKLLEINGVVYNPNEAGNYLWGMVLAYNEVPSPATFAELATPGRRDEPYDQKAIKEGDKFGEIVDKIFSKHPVKKAMTNYEKNGQSKKDYDKIKAIQDQGIEDYKDSQAAGFGEN